MGSTVAFLPDSRGRAEQNAGPEEPLVIFTEFTDYGESLLVSPASESEQADAAETLNRELGPRVYNDELPAGKLRVSPHVEMRATFDDNIFIQSKNEVEDFIFTLSPGLTIGFWDSKERRTDTFLDRQDPVTPLNRGSGTYFAVDYTAILLGFARTHSQNAFDQDARIDGRVRAEKWTLGGGLRYESKSEANTDIGTRIRRKTLSAEAEAAYRFSDKTSIDTTASIRANDPEDYVRSTAVQIESFATYDATPLVRVGLGGAFGGVAVDGGSDDVFERALARVAYQYSDKLDFEVRGGVEFRQSDGPAGDRVSPIFRLLANYRPTEGTRVAVEAFQSVETSEFRPDESYERTGFTGSIQRAIRPAIHLHLDAGYQQTDYSGLASETERRDHYFFMRPGILYNIVDWANAGMTYEFRDNDSNRADSNFRNNQVSFQVNIIY